MNLHPNFLFFSHFFISFKLNTAETLNTYWFFLTIIVFLNKLNIYCYSSRNLGDDNGHDQKLHNYSKKSCIIGMSKQSCPIPARFDRAHTSLISKKQYPNTALNYTPTIRQLPATKHQTTTSWRMTTRS